MVEIDGKLAASSSSLVLEYDPSLEWHNWKAVADSGYIRNHNPKGDTLYGIEIMVDPEFRGMKLSRRLYDARKDLARRMNLARIVIAGRIPGYGKFAEEMPASEYIDKVAEKAIYDPVMTAQMSNGFAVRGLIPNYLAADSDSCGYATFLEWVNLNYVPGAKRRFHSAVEPIRICVVQYQMRSIKSFEDFAKQCEFFLDTASDYKCDFILFPELFTTQLLSCVDGMRPGLAARQLAEFTPQYLEFFTEMAVRYDVNVIGGSQFVVEHDTLYNISYLFGRDGSIGKQYKIHITPSERKWWGVTPGDKVEVFDTDCGRVAIQICYDIEFPELTRIAAHKGAQVIFVPFNTTLATAICACVIVLKHAASRIICSWRSPGVRGICRSSRTRTSTTLNPGSLHRQMPSLLVTPSLRNVIQMLKRSSFTMSTSNSCVTIAKPAASRTGTIADAICIKSLTKKMANNIGSDSLRRSVRVSRPRRGEGGWGRVFEPPVIVSDCQGLEVSTPATSRLVLRFSSTALRCRS